MKSKFLLLIVLSAIIFTGLIGAITFQNIFPTTTPYVTSDDTVNLSYGIHAGDGLSAITHSWNGTNTTLYNQDLVLFMNFDNRSELGENSTLIIDNSLYENNGVITGTNFTTGFEDLNNVSYTPNGKYDGALNFTGRKAWVQIPDSDSLDFNRTTIAFWIKIPPNGGANDIMRKYESASSQRSFSFLLTAGKPRFTITSNGSVNTLGAEYQYSTATTNISDGNWHWVVGMYNDTHMSIWVDNINEDRDAFVKGIYANNATLKIGQQFLATSYLNGSIDDLIILNRSLTSTELTILYNSQITKYNSSYLVYNTTKSLTANLQSSFLCSTNSTEDEFCSTTQQSSQVNTLKANFSNSIGTIRNDFYGVSQYNVYFSNYSWISSTGASQPLNERADADKMFELLNNANIKMLRTWAFFRYLSVSEGVFNTSDFSGLNVQTFHNINAIKDQTERAYDNNISLIYVLQDSPTWNDNTTSGWCVSTGTYGYGSCSPINYTKQGEMYCDFLDYITNNGAWNSTIYGVEIGNEPYGPSWLNNLSTDNPIKASEYVRLFNETRTIINACYPNIKVFGNAGTRNNPNMKFTFLNSTVGLTEYSEHPYAYDNTGGYMYDNSLYVDVANMVSNTTYYNHSVNHWLATEWGDWGAWGNISTDNGIEAELGFAYQSILNTYPSNVTMMFHEFSLYWNWYPTEISKRDMYSHTRGDILYVPYNVTKNFAHLCPAGGNVWQHSNDGECVEFTACSKGNMFSIIGVNKCNYSQNYTANLSLTNGSVFYPYTSIMNYETGASIPVSTEGIIQLGVIGPHEVLYLSNDTTKPVITINTPTSPTGDVNSVSLAITLNKAVASCSYTLNNGASQSMTNSGLETQYYATVPISKFTNVFTVTCLDEYGNIGTTSITALKSANRDSIWNEQRSPFLTGFNLLSSIGGLLIMVLIIFLVIIPFFKQRIDIRLAVMTLLRIILVAVILGAVLIAIG